MLWVVVAVLTIAVIQVLDTVDKLVLQVVGVDTLVVQKVQ
jgi:hypothetical protein